MIHAVIPSASVTTNTDALAMDHLTVPPVSSHGGCNRLLITAQKQTLATKVKEKHPTPNMTTISQRKNINVDTY